MSEKLPIPRALYPCKHCAEDYSWPAEDLYWSAITKAWVCESCWDDDVHGERVTRIGREIQRQREGCDNLCQTEPNPNSGTMT